MEDENILLQDRILRKMLWEAAKDEVSQLGIERISWEEREQLILIRTIRLAQAKVSAEKQRQRLLEGKP